MRDIPSALQAKLDSGVTTLAHCWKLIRRDGVVQGVSMINQPSNRPGVNAMLNEAYRMKFVPATDRGDAVAVSMVWLVSNTTVKGRHDETMQALRQALRLRTTPAPISALPVPAEAATDPKPAAAPLTAKPNEGSALEMLYASSLAATEGL